MAEPQDDGVSSSESETEQGNVPQLSERRRKHNAILASFIKERADEKLAGPARMDRVREGKEEEMTIQALMNRHTDKKIIESPRDYQLELFERAKERNTLAVLDTGSGKTLIAALLIRWMLEKELQHRHDGGRRRIAFFVVGGVALAFQQHSMLQRNLDFKIEKLYGSMNVELYSQEQWDSIFSASMGIVCTSEILLQCLTRSFITIPEINLLIFDEAHHAKKDHSFSRIMKDHYHKYPKQDRPRVFGMTASPVDAKVSVVEAAKELETLLDCQIATSRLLSMARPQEKILPYLMPPKPYGTTFCHKLASCFGKSDAFDGLLENAQLFTAQLGEWCGDHYWRQCLREEAGPKFENQYKKQHEKTAQEYSARKANEFREAADQARAIVNEHHFLDPHMIGRRALSSKVNALKLFLESEFENPTQSKCIVFVRYRQIAFLLVDLFACIGTAHLKCAAMVGTRPADIGEMSYTLRTQIETLSKFEKGHYNCLFATTVAEEGLDVADCNLIVRFDLYDTMIQYVQSRGRARHHNSKYIHMLERGNQELEDRFRLARTSEEIMREFVEKLPKDRLLLGNEADLEKTMSKEKGYQRYKEESTGALLTYHSSLTVLHHFLDFLPQNAGGAVPLPTYMVQAMGNGYVCEIIFPSQAPIKSITGKKCSRKGLAKRAAAFNACIKLREMALLDEHLMPTIHRVLPAMRNARLALDEHKKSAYTIKSKPDRWKNEWGTVPDELFAVIFDFDEPGVCGRDHVPLILLTRSRLPQIPSFPLWPQPDVRSNVTSVHMMDTLPCDSGMLDELTLFTLRIFRDVYNKEYEHSTEKMSYWIAPVVAATAVWEYTPVSQLVDWEAVRSCIATSHLVWQPDMPDKDVVDRYFIDPGDGSRRFFSEGIDFGLRPTDKPPVGVAPAKPKYMATILDYSDSTWGARRHERQVHRDQPVLKAFKPSQRHDIFQPWSSKEREVPTLAYICPQPLHISTLPTAVVTMAYCFSAVIWRVESYMIAQEACQHVGLTISTDLALEALTKDSDNTQEHRKAQLNVQRGMGRNYERLEFIGDAFLKLATTVALYTQNENDNEFSSHVNRMLMICNQNLFQHAVKTNLYEYVRVTGFSRRHWYPEGLTLLKGKGFKTGGALEEVKHALSDKTIADICEALIGASLLTFAESGNMDMAVKSVTTMVNSTSHQMKRWSQYYDLYRLPEYQTAESTAVQIDLAGKVFLEHNYRFRYPRLIQSAFTHPSHPTSWDNIPNYQRLEFLGDALLDMVCVNYLYRKYPDRDPQWLTEHKMAIVSNRFLGALCVRLGFNRHMRSYNSGMLAQIKVYCEEIEEVEKKAKGAVDYWMQIAKDPPKCLADIVESFIGAVFVDSEYSFKEVERFFDQHILPYFQDMTIYDTFANNHPMVALSGMLNETYRCQDFRVMSEEIPNDDGTAAQVCSVVIIHDRIIQDVWSTSSRYGKAKAASRAKEKIEGLAPYEYRAKYGCTCKPEDELEPKEQIPAGHQVASAM